MARNPESTSPSAASPLAELEARLRILATADPDSFTRIDPDPMTADVHANCDAEFVTEDALNSAESVFDNPTFVSISQCTDLLDSLAKSPSCKPYLKSADTLQSDLKAAVRKLDRHASQALKEVCTIVLAQGKSASFRELRRFRCLIKPGVWNHATNPTAAAAADTRLNLESTRQAWKAPVYGGYHRLLYEEMDNMAKGSRKSPYGNILPIIQSSGMGKSRTVYEMGALVFSLPLNIHSVLSDKDRDMVYPLPDAQIRDYLTDLKLKTAAEAKDRYAAFFHALFEVATKRLVEKLEPGKVYESLSDLASAWRQYLETPEDENQVGNQGPISRDILYRDVVTLARQGRPEGVPVTGPRSSIAKLEEAIRSRIRGPAKLLKDKVLLVVSLDEAHTLSDIKLESASEDSEGLSHRTAYDSLWSTWVDFTIRHCAVGMSLSTQSRLSAHAPPQERSHSSRGGGQTAVHHAPWCELPFDCYPETEPIFVPGQHTLHDVTQDDYMALFGRPIFASRLRNEAKGSPVRKEIVDFALFKLMGKNAENLAAAAAQVKAGLSLSTKLVPLAVRILPDFDLSLEVARETEEEMVTSHLRVVFSIPSHRLFMRSGYPSEPLVAKAAAIAMNIIAPHSHPIEIVAKELESGLINKGSRGELLARLLLTLAHDRAALSMRRPDDTKTNWDPLIPVCTFLSSLFTEDVAKIIMTCTSNDPSHPERTLAQAFEHGYVRFSHFIAMAELNSIDTHLGLAGLARGFAIQAAFQQKLYDIAIPVVMKADLFTESDVTFIIIQVKNRVKTDNLYLDDVPKDFPGFFGANNLQPYIALGMELGVDEHPKTPLVEITTPSLGRAPARNLAPKQHPCYGFTVSGHSRGVYRVVESQEHEDKLAGILGKVKLLTKEHPRQNPGVLSKVRRLKYSWSREKECFDWVKDPELVRLVKDKVPSA
ncbi:hypothetical protein PsYK624_102870 [Phanerochaete sordida]|uniref:Uncharacterized protein n=1 Tax=Phanerochaete sordida TaxID=48140 RepID=A0A9P3LGY1_9APHY|nr:hypothetical protein PsYK624_102870 [Phanerochaete sordida]